MTPKAASGMAEDGDLLRRIADGSEPAMRTFYERHGEAIHRFARSWLGDPFEAADVMHETMLHVWTAAASFEGRSSPRTWLFTIARNKSIDRLRRQMRVELEELDPHIADEDGLEADQLLAAAEEAAHLRACITTLAPPLRAVIHLAFFEQLAYAEIAEIEGCPVGTIKTRIMRAKRLLLKCLRCKGVIRAC